MRWGFFTMRGAKGQCLIMHQDTVTRKIQNRFFSGLSEIVCLLVYWWSKKKTDECFLNHHHYYYFGAEFIANEANAVSIWD